MEYTTEVVNITKIKDGFFLGDEATAANLDVIVQFKITHMVNAAGTQIINAWETIGIKYLTLKWSEHSTCNLFDPKDEIANRIVDFIDDSMSSGEGLLVHSLRGQNRGCMVVIIYLIKKYLNSLYLRFRWTLAKGLEFLQNKKCDVEIPKYFLQQISMFESRLSKLGQGPKSNDWNYNNIQADPDDWILRNTFLNGLPNKPDGKLLDIPKGVSYGLKKLTWSDSMINRKDLCSINYGKELVNMKDIKPITVHKLKKPIKSSMKSKSSDKDKSYSFISVPKLSENITSSLIRDSNSQLMSNKDYSINNKITPPSTQQSINFADSLKQQHSNILLKNYTNVNVNGLYSSLKAPEHSNIAEDKPTLSKSLNMDRKENLNNNINNRPNLTATGNTNPAANIRKNNFENTSQNDPKIRSYSVGQDPDKSNNNQPDPKIIIASKYQNIVNNFNNIIIQSTDDLDKFKQTNYESRQSSNIKKDPTNYTNNYYNPQYVTNPSNYSINMSSNNVQNITPVRNISNQGNISNYKEIGVNPGKNNLESKLMQNNYFTSNQNPSTNSFLEKMKVIDYNTANKSKTPPYQNPMMNTGYNNPQSVKNTVLQGSKNPINNYQPDLIKKNQTGILNRNNTQITKPGPVKIQADYDRKPLTPDNSGTNITTMKLGSSMNSRSTNNTGISPSNTLSYGTLKRSNSNKKSDLNERPSTAPQKEENNRSLANNSSLKRLPSPSGKGMNLSNTQKLNYSSNSSSKRAPSPAAISKNSTITVGTLKSAKSNKWK